MAALDHALQRRLRDQEAAVGGHHQRLAYLLAIEAEKWPADAIARVVDHHVRRLERAEKRVHLRGVGDVTSMDACAGLLRERLQLANVARGKRDAHSRDGALARERGGQAAAGADDDGKL